MTSGLALIECLFLDHSKNNGWDPSCTAHKIWKYEPSVWFLWLNKGLNFGAVVIQKALLETVYDLLEFSIPADSFENIWCKTSAKTQ